MPHLNVICRYCDHRWNTYVYGTSEIESLKCPRCGDTNLKTEHHDETKSDVFGYAGAPKEDAYIKRNKT